MVRSRMYPEDELGMDWGENSLMPNSPALTDHTLKILLLADTLLI